MQELKIMNHPLPFHIVLRQREILVRNLINTFKSSILNFVRPRENSVFEVHDIKGVKLLTCLRLDFGHLNEHKF